MTPHRRTEIRFPEIVGMPDYAPVETRDTNLPLGVPSLFCLEAAPIRDVSRTSDTTWQVQSNDQWLPPGEETLKEMR